MKLLHAVALALALTSSASQAQETPSKVIYQGAPRYLAIRSLAVRQQNDLLALNVEFSNSDREDQDAFYRVTWLDESGFPVWEPEPWKPILLHGKEQRSMVIVAPSAKAKDFRLHFSATANSTLGN